MELPSSIQGVPHVADYFGVWAMYEPHAAGLLATARSINLQLHISQHAADPDQQAQLAAASDTRLSILEDKIAVIELHGSLMKHASSLSMNTSTLAARRQIRKAADSADVAGILIHVDSPGGTVAGMHDLAADIRAAGRKKPVHSYIEDLGASAAYWAACQAGRLVCGESAIVGSIGVFSVVYEYSRMVDAEGIDVHVLRFGELKGAGTPGTKITDEQLAHWQSRVDHFGDDFVAAVAGGRNVAKKRARELADGRVWIGKAALQEGLVDAVESLDLALDKLIRETKQTRTPQGNRAMSDQSIQSAELLSTEPKAATLTELRADRDLEGASAEFLLAQLERGATLDQARRAWDREQLAAERKAREEAEAKAADAEQKAAAAEEKSAKSQRGVKPLGEGTKSDAEYDGDAAEEFRTKVDALVEKGMPRQQACSKVNRKHPELREAMVAAANA